MAGLLLRDVHMLASMSMGLSLLKASQREHLAHDLGPVRGLVAQSLYSACKLLLSGADKRRAFQRLAQLHRAALSPRIDREITVLLRDAVHGEKQGRVTGLGAFYDGALQESLRSAGQKPERLIGSRILVVKASRPRERGVLVVDYSYVFPLLTGLFDLRAIAEKYFIVLEPSWSGFCTPEILLYSQFDFPVFVESGEPRDSELIAGLASNLATIPVAANWWVDHRLMTPLPRDQRDIDIIMVAQWAAFKRHGHFFRALGRLRKRGHKPKVVLVGYPKDTTGAAIEAQARYFGVADQITLFERITPREVGNLLSRSKLHVLWSRREGINRATVEAMFADVPVILREGMNYGYRYPHVNPATGRFAREDDLDDVILEMLDNHAQYAPREWAMKNMTCQRATSIVETHVRAAAHSAGEAWSEGLVAKVSELDTQRYWHQPDRERFQSDYRFLESTILDRARRPH